MVKFELKGMSRKDKLSFSITELSGGIVISENGVIITLSDSKLSEELDYFFKMKNKNKDILFNNLIYCEDTHSFTHRLFDKFNELKPQNKVDAQCIGMNVLNEMWSDLENTKK